MLVAGIFYAATMVKTGGKGLYMGLILIWALPFVSILWYVGTFLG